jgi:hypothetical protein
VIEARGLTQSQRWFDERLATFVAYAFIAPGFQRWAARMQFLDSGRRAGGQVLSMDVVRDPVVDPHYSLRPQDGHVRPYQSELWFHREDEWGKRLDLMAADPRTRGPRRVRNEAQV